MRAKRGAFFAATLAILTLSACFTPLSGSRSGTARVNSLEGSAEVSRGDGAWESASLWHKFSAGDRARTGADGTLNLTLGRYGGVLTLMPGSLLEFEQLGPVEGNPRIVAVLNLREGRVVGDTLKLPEGTQVQVKTRAGVHEIP